jgi:hypothetical protein
MTAINLFTSKAAAEQNILLNKPTSASTDLFQTIKLSLKQEDQLDNSLTSTQVQTLGMDFPIAYWSGEQATIFVGCSCLICRI